MRHSSLIYRCALAEGILLFVFTLIHATLGLNEMLLGSKTGAINKDYSSQVIIAWIFSSVSMFLLGCWLLFLAKDLKLFQKKAWWQGLLVSGGMIFFGIISFYLYPDVYFIIAFSLCGSILFFPLLLFSPLFWKKKIQNKEPVMKV